MSDFKFSFQKKEFDVIGFGEVMLRLSPPDKERIVSSESFEKRAGGSELNVVSGISLLGLRTGIVTRLPDNEIGKFIKNKIRYYGVSDDYIIFDKDATKRLGIYYYEFGAYPRKPTVVYDRADSSLTSLQLSELPDEIFKKTNIFHVSGISLALSSHMRDTVVEMIKRFKEAGAYISFDVNYRQTLWSEQDARETIRLILPYVDILFISEESCRKMMQQTGSLEEIMKSYASQYSTSLVATTRRTVASSNKHSFTSKIYSAFDDKFYSENEYKDIEVVDRIGSGDAYVAGVLFGLLKYSNVQNALEFGNAMSAVKNTIAGDIPSSDFSEISSIISSHKSNVAGSELNR